MLRRLVVVALAELAVTHLRAELAVLAVLALLLIHHGHLQLLREFLELMQVAAEAVTAAVLVTLLAQAAAEVPQQELILQTIVPMQRQTLALAAVGEVLALALGKWLDLPLARLLVVQLAECLAVWLAACFLLLKVVWSPAKGMMRAVLRSPRLLTQIQLLASFLNLKGSVSVHIGMLTLFALVLVLTR
jgi:hypothetical protein